MKAPLLSVVMSVCNVDRFLVESLESILGQSFREFEFVVVDYGSTDKSKSIVANYAARDSRIVLSEIPKCTLPEARNAGCSLARGRYIAIMDADDVSLPDRLMFEIDFMERNPGVGLLGGAAEWINALRQPLFVLSNPTGYGEIKSELLTRNPFCHPTVIIRKEVFTLVGGYRKALQASHDYDLFLRIAEHFECANLKQVVLRYRIHASQISITKQRQQTLCKLAAQASASCRRRGVPDPLNSVREVSTELLASMGVTEARLKHELAADCRDWVHNMFLAGEYDVALRVALDFFRSDLRHVERWQRADLLVWVARIYRRQNRVFSCMLAALCAVANRPALAGTLLRSSLRKPRLV